MRDGSGTPMFLAAVLWIGVSASCMIEDGGVHREEGNSASMPESVQGTPEENSHILHFIKQEFPEGVPYDRAKSLGPSAVPVLIGLLEDPKYENYHGRAVVVLGILGDPTARDALIKYIERSRGLISEAKLEAMLNAPMALGLLAAQGDQASLDYLFGRSAPSEWGHLEWRIAGAPIRTRDLIMTRATLNGLGISGQPEAFGLLRKINSAKETRKLLGESARDNMELCERVGRLGLAQVFGSRGAV